MEENSKKSVSLLMKKIPGYLRTTFLSALTAGLLTHLYLLTNKLPNHDDISHLFSCTYGAESGRWLLPTVLHLSGDFSTPWLNGLLSVFWLSVAACFVVELFRIRRPVFCVLTAVWMVAFPSVTSTLTYMFTADGYFLALAMACAAAFCAARFRYGSLIGVLLIVCSMAIYQSYFAVSAALCVGVLLLELLDGSRPRQVIGRAVRLFLTLLAGMLLYLLSVRISRLCVTLTDYKGINTIGQISLSELPSLIAETYSRYADFFVKTGAPLHSVALRVMYVLSAVCAGIQWIRIGVQRGFRVGSWALSLLLLAAFLLAANIVTIMSPTQTPHLLMLYGLCLVPVLMLSLCEAAARAADSVIVWKTVLHRICTLITALTLAWGGGSYAVAANQAYLKIDISFRSLNALSTRLLSAIEQTPGYYAGLQVVFVGHPASMLYGDPTPELSDFEWMGVFSVQDYLDTYTYPAYLKAYHGFTGEIHTVTSDVAIRLMEREDVQNMPAYPSDGSVRVIGNCVVVHFRW